MKQEREIFNHNKAGLGEVDKSWAKRVIYEASRKTKYFEHEQKLGEVAAKRIEALVARAESLSPKEVAAAEGDVDQRVVNMMGTSPASGFGDATFSVYVDMDAFYCAVEELDNPDLVGKAHAVGGMSMLCTASYEARKFGVRSAMPGFIARKLCPSLIFDKPRFDRYREVSKQVKEALMFFDPNCEMRSLDEAYLDITSYMRQAGDTQTFADAVDSIRASVKQASKLSCSAGGGANALIAKIASDFNKPDGQTIVAHDRQSMLDFLQPLPARKIPGIGKVTEQMLSALGIQTIREIYDRRGSLSLLFHEKTFTFLLRSCLALPSESGRGPRKGMSRERTFSATRDENEIRRICRLVCELLAGDMSSREDLRAKTVTVKIKLSSFEVRTRSRTLAMYISTADELFKEMWSMVSVELPIEVRLLGTRVSSFECDEMVDSTQKTMDIFLQDSNLLTPVLVSTNASPRKRTRAPGGEDPREMNARETPMDGSDAASGRITCPVCDSFSHHDTETVSRHANRCLDLISRAGKTRRRIEDFFARESS